jgi:adenylate cyclase
MSEIKTDTQSSDKAGPKFLVVDDESFNRSLLVRHLNNEGITNVDTADNGREALDILKGGDADVILLDINMPEMDGFEVLRQLKADMRLRHIPVIMISGVEGVESVVECIELGAEDYLQKPFNPVILRARVNACLDKKRFRDQERHYLDRVKSEKERADKLLNVILPPAAAAELKISGAVVPRRFDNVAVLFADIVSFTSFCESHEPEQVVTGLQKLFEKFEELTSEFRMEKIKTIGDEYMSTAGLLEPNMDPLLSSVKCAIAMIEATKSMEIDWQIRAGVNQGPVIGGIVGQQKYQYDVWGDTVNTAARMTAAASPNTVAMNYDSWLIVQDYCEGRSLGQMEIKGKGKIEVIECYGMR